MAVPEDLRDGLRVVFRDTSDHAWVDEIPDDTWRRLIRTLEIEPLSAEHADEELVLAVRVLAHHAASLGLQPEFTDRLPDLESPHSPFLRLAGQVLAYLDSPEVWRDGSRVYSLDDALDCVADCRREVERFRAASPEEGTSLWLTLLSYRLLRILDRIDVLLHLTDPVARDFEASAIRLFKELVRAELTRDSVISHVRASADLVALEVVEHAARKGSKYITTTRREYGRFLLSSMGGGVFVALFSLAKVLMGHWEMPLAGQALLYGLNYSLCFVLIYVTGATLATKQPAMTANTIARSLGDSGRDITGLEDLVVRVWRSQFISFVGNIVVALPLAFLLSEVYFRGIGDLVASPETARYMLANLHPWESGTLVFAAVAGVLLFLAGLVSGAVDNWSRLQRVPERIEHLPWFSRIAGPKRAGKFAAATETHLGAVMGNVFLGFGLGSMGTLGEILGLPLDIRHVAFASAEFGTSLEILHLDVPLETVGVIALGVALIGLVNFIVSFGLSLVVAVESRGLGLAGSARFAWRLFVRFVRNPLAWFFPPRSA